MLNRLGLLLLLMLIVLTRISVSLLAGVTCGASILAPGVLHQKLKAGWDKWRKIGSRKGRRWTEEKRGRDWKRRKEEKWNVGGSHCLFKRSQEIAKNRTPCSGRGTIWSYWARPQRRDGSRGRIPSINRRDYIALCVCWPYVFTAHCALNNLIEFARALRI